MTLPDRSVATRDCETCRHWNSTEYAGTVRRASGEREPGPWGFCMLLSDYGGGEDEPGGLVSTLAFTLDSSDWRSWLMVRADFGCVEHETSSEAVPTGVDDSPTEGEAHT